MPSAPSLLHHRSFTIVALGSNLGDSRQILLRAMERLQSFSEHPLVKSALWQSTPLDCPPGSPDFLNAVVGLIPRAEETPESFLKRLQSLEKEFGRRPKRISNEPRPLDLDLVAFGRETRCTATLTLPHPRAHCRRFVLAPLAEIAPEYVLPGQIQTIAQLLSGLATNEIVERAGEKTE